MEGLVCTGCYSWFAPETAACPTCGIPVIVTGEQRTVIDHIEPNCLIHRYDGSDLLEPATVIKEGKINLKVATKLHEYQNPVTVPKR